jgi:hypothetical protein
MRISIAAGCKVGGVTGQMALIQMRRRQNGQ